MAVGGLLLLGAAAALLWFGSDRRPVETLEQKRTYDTTPAPAEQDTFTVVSYNLGGVAPEDGASVEPDSASSFDRATALLRSVEPDFVALQDMRLPDGDPPLDAMARRLNAAASAVAGRRDDRLSSMWARLGGRPLASGQVLLSRFPIRRHARRPIDRDSSSFWGRFAQAEPVVQVAVVGIGGWPLVVMNVNLDAVDATARKRQARAVNRLYRRISNQGLPVLVLGSIGPSRPEDRAALPDTETRRLLLRGTNLQPAIYAESALVSGRAVATYPATDPERKLDHIFYSPSLVVPTEAHVRCGGASPPSDHCAISFSFLLPRPVDQLPDTQIPDEKLPSLDRLLTPASGA
jgi:endonuclease/exonuclease/phosphatase family metal-dependent hydrolase